jgi:hypothetical protein
LGPIITCRENKLEKMHFLRVELETGNVTAKGGGGSGSAGGTREAKEGGNESSSSGGEEGSESEGDDEGLAQRGGAANKAQSWIRLLCIFFDDAHWQPMLQLDQQPNNRLELDGGLLRENHPAITSALEDYMDEVGE